MAENEKSSSDRPRSGPFFTWKEQLAETSVGKIFLSNIVDFKKV